MNLYTEAASTMLLTVLKPSRAMASETPVIFRGRP